MANVLFDYVRGGDAVLRKVNILLMVCFLGMTLIMGGCGSTPEKSASTPHKYPVKPITIIVPFSAGGSVDVMARALEKSATKHLGQPLMVVNKPGGGATVGLNELAGVEPDGYTVGVTTVAAILQPLYGPTKYNYPTALEPLVQAATVPVVAVVQAGRPWKNLNELIQYAKQHPGEIKYGHGGIGTSVHVTGEMFAKTAGIVIKQVPFRGASEAITALLGGHVQMIFANPAAVKEHMKSGSVRVLAVAEGKRLSEPGFAQVPTFKEQGLNVVFNNWQGIGAPKGLPADVKNRLAEGFKGMINDPAFKQKMEGLGMKVEYLGPKESVDKWIAENARLAKVIKESGIANLIAAQKK